ncbi:MULTISPECIES: CBS domain-containing protein [Halomonadaceae]|uniref:CBS domain-containing protein n=1 Tax=Halomonadaceae TaxID=28256 RepID=UPI00159A7A92|nr:MULTISPECIES: CBS domain-containing protein [Halomonas]QJQ94711.1 CBS domain-containing protein [Halomonas sp. PA5]
MPLSLGLTQALQPINTRLAIEHPPRPTAPTPDTSAIAVLTDFTQTPPRTICESTPIGQAHRSMLQEGVRLLLVTDESGHLSGILNAREVIGGRRITLAMQHHGLSREEVTVKMVQTPGEALHAMPYAQLARLTIGELMEALRSYGDQHLLITSQGDDGAPRLRGLVSASDIGRALGVELTLAPEARSFADICQVVLGHEL